MRSREWPALAAQHLQQQEALPTAEHRQRNQAHVSIHLFAVCAWHALVCDPVADGLPQRGANLRSTTDCHDRKEDVIR